MRTTELAKRWKDMNEGGVRRMGMIKNVEVGVESERRKEATRGDE